MKKYVLALLMGALMTGCSTQAPFAPSLDSATVDTIEANELVGTQALNGGKLENILGVGETQANKLRAIGLNTPQKLLDAANTRKERDDLAAKTGIPYISLFRWVNQLDLMRIDGDTSKKARGIGFRQAYLLDGAGVYTLYDLSRRNPDNLVKKLGEANVSHPRYPKTKRPPTMNDVQHWIATAKTMKSYVTP